MSSRGEAEVEDFGDEGVEDIDDIDDVGTEELASEENRKSPADDGGAAAAQAADVEEDAIPSLGQGVDEVSEGVKADNPADDDTADVADADSALNKSASSSMNQDGLVADVIDIIMKEANLEGSLAAVFDVQLSDESATDMDLASLDAFLKVKKLRVDRDELRRLFDERIQSLCSIDDAGSVPGFTELYLFVTECEA
eukprot:g619.t1